VPSAAQSTEDRHPAAILVVGGGFLGSHVAGGLAARGFPTTVLTRTPPSPAAEAQVGAASLRVGDAADADVLSASLDGADHVVWCAGGLLPADSNQHPASDLTSALLPLLNALECLRRRSGVGLTYFSSGGTVYGNADAVPVSELHPTGPLTSHGVTKVAAEHYLSLYTEVYGVPSLALRCGNVYGPGQPADRSQGLIAAALESQRRDRPLPVYGDGMSVRDFIFIDDVVDVVCALVRRAGVPPVVNVGSGLGTSVAEALGIVESVTGRPIELERHPARPGDVRRVVLDVTRLKSLLPDFRATRLTDGVARMWNQLERAQATRR
jgi:UDP-glucose 4-epimerase